MNTSPYLTMKQALEGQHFHFTANRSGSDDMCSVTYGKTGKAQPKLHVQDWRRNGVTKTWKTRPDEFRIPVKFGMYGYDYIIETDHAHLADDCHAVIETKEYWETRRDVQP